MMSHEGATLKNGTTSIIADDLDDDPSAHVGPDDPAALAVKSALAHGDRQLQRNDASARQGEVEGVHRMRTAARRLRSELCLFGDLIEGDWGDKLSLELRWLGQLLGTVRDLDVLSAGLAESSGDLTADLAPLFATLGDRHEAASAELQEAFQSVRYRDLLEQVSELALHPALREEAWEPCRKVLPRLVYPAWKWLKAAASALDLSDPDEDYHEIRKRAKRARHGAESVARALDTDASNDARRFAKRAVAVQDVLGVHQDATIACREIRRVAAERPGDGPFNLASGRLLERQEDIASDARTRFFKCWHKLDRKKNRRWMKV